MLVRYRVPGTLVHTSDLYLFLIILNVKFLDVQFEGTSMFRVDPDPVLFLFSDELKNINCQGGDTKVVYIHTMTIPTRIFLYFGCSKSKRTMFLFLNICLIQRMMHV